MDGDTWPSGVLVQRPWGSSSEPCDGQDPGEKNLCSFP